MTATTLPPYQQPAEPAVPSSRAARLLRGQPGDPRWARPAVGALLLGTALLYLWGLGSSGWANSFYSAAVQAGTQSWKAFFFGSFDSSNFITVDKPPASLWVMELSGRVFGVNSWSILVPNALEGVAAVGLLYAAVKRAMTRLAGSPAYGNGTAGTVGGLVAGAVMALTPVATLMFRFNNPDALLVLLLVGAAYATTRALEAASTRWLLLAGALVGFGFLTKMLQALLVLPALALAYLIAAPTPVRRRLLQLLAGGAALVVSAGWWVLVVTLWPASSRPYIGGSQNNSVLDLVLGYNGLGRITGNETGSVVPGGGQGGGSMWGETGLTRLFNTENGGQVSWLLPAALILMVGLFALTARAPRTNTYRAAMIIWGGWLVVTGLVFSLMQGIFHPYYSVALAPAVGGVVGIGAVSLWRARHLLWVRAVLAGAVAVTAWWAYKLLARSPDWHPSLRTLVLVGGLIVAAAILAAPALRSFGVVVGVAALVVGLAGPAAYALETASTPHTGAIPSAGPAVSGGFGGPGGGRGGRGPGGFPGGGFPGNAQGGGFPGNTQGGGFPGGGVPGGQQGTGNAGGPGGGGLGGLLNAGTPSAELVQLLNADAGTYTWVAATVGANSAAGVQLAAGNPVMAIGGFNGTDPTPTLETFKALVAAHRIHYFLSNSGMGGNGSSSQSISTWVAQNFTSTTVGNVTVYDLTATPSSRS